MTTCHITFNTKDNKETHRYEVWCTPNGGDKRLIGWSTEPDNDYFMDVVLLICGDDLDTCCLEFVDTTEPTGGGE